MTRGNQRDLAREKAAKKAGKGESASETAANAGIIEIRLCVHIHRELKLDGAFKVKGKFVTSSEMKNFQNPSCPILEKVNENYDKKTEGRITCIS